MGVGLLLLPGMDGTGRLFRPFLEQVPSKIWTKVVAYPHDRVMGYDDLLPLVKEQIDASVPHVVLAESFSGPLAVEYAHHQSDVAAVVFCGSFVSNPLPRGLGWLPKLAHPTLAAVAMRELVLRAFLLDFSTPRDHVAQVLQAIRAVDPAVLVARMRAVAAVNVADKLKELQVPILYIAARRDRMIGMRGARQIIEAVPHADVRILDAPHLLLQAKPAEAASVIFEFLDARSVLENFKMPGIDQSSAE